MKNIPLHLLLLSLSILPAQAALPRDAQFRRQDIYNYRQRKTADYERAQQHHETRMLTSDRTVRETFAVSPWAATTLPGATNDRRSPEMMSSKAGFARHGSRWMLGVLSLVFLGGCAWWVKVSTGTEPD